MVDDGLDCGAHRAAADDTNIQSRVLDDGQSSFDGVVDPVVAIAESSAAKSGQQDNVGAAGARLLGGGQQGCFVGGLQDQSCEQFPVMLG